MTVHYLTIHYGTLREVSFVSFEFDMAWEIALTTACCFIQETSIPICS
ncbi:hypothetical protein PO124_33655 [Bacillus licheniformis]|nr:hypothetical protein [Bacillus licheniformis]